jgi:hypothetical protein
VKRVIVSLVIAAGAVYALNTWLLPNTSSRSGDGEGPVGMASSGHADRLPPVDEQRTDRLTPPVDASSPHAIVAEGGSSRPLANAELRSTRESAKPPLDGSGPTLPNIDDTQIERVKVTGRASIQEGPSASTPIIGIAHQGAEAQVISRDSEWAQIIDPTSKKMGWVHSQFLEPQTDAASTAEQIEAALEPADETMTPPPRAEGSLKKPGKQGWKQKRHRRGFALRKLRRFF